MYVCIYIYIYVYIHIYIYMYMYVCGFGERMTNRSAAASHHTCADTDTHRTEFGKQTIWSAAM